MNRTIKLMRSINYLVLLAIKRISHLDDQRNKVKLWVFASVHKTNLSYKFTCKNEHFVSKINYLTHVLTATSMKMAVF
jgi:hypothetical protein